MKLVKVYTDGACSGNPGPGGTAWSIFYTDKKGEVHFKKGSRSFRRTTNNRMELTALIDALAALKVPCTVIVYTDSKYIVDAIGKGWLLRWQKKDFRNIMNPDLWKRVTGFLAIHSVVFRWVAGHSGDAENEECDARATAACESSSPEIDTIYEETTATK